MSRTTRVNLIYSTGKGKEDAICRDGKQRWKCKCSYCLSNSRIRTTKEKDRVNLKNDLEHQIDSSSDAMDFFYPEKQVYLDKHSYNFYDDDWFDYTQYESFIG